MIEPWPHAQASRFIAGAALVVSPKISHPLAEVHLEWHRDGTMTLDFGGALPMITEQPGPDGFRFKLVPHNGAVRRYPGGAVNGAASNGKAARFSG